MRFSDSFLEDIRQRLPISQVVGEHVVWDKRKSNPGRGDYWACCPFHGEKTPSFHADDRKGIYHCFGCGVTGDHFRFLTERTGIAFPEAVEKLAGLAGIAMPQRDPQAEKREAERRSLYDVMEMATGYFEAALSHNIGARARGYLNERQVSAGMQKRFRLGFSPDSRNGLKEYLAQNGVSARDMAAAGLVISGDDIAVPYDRFRNRLMFPITDFRGRVIAFGGRALSPDVPAKYLNSPETELFHKRSVLFNGQMARQAAHEGKPVVVVEGYLDVIAAVAAGFEGAVAPLGTALSADHANLLWRMSDVPILCFDGDNAGQRAAARTLEIVMPLLGPGKTVRIATLPQGVDPDDLIRAEGPAAFNALLGKARALAETVWDIETRGAVLESPEARAALEQRLRERAHSIADNSVRRHYLQAFEEKLRALFAPVRANRPPNYAEGGGSGRSNRGGRQMARGRSGVLPKLVVSEALRNSRLLQPGRRGEASPREAVIVLSVINFPALAEARLEDLARLQLEGAGAQAVLADILDNVALEPGMSGVQMRERLIGLGHGRTLQVMQEMLARQGVWQVGDDAAETDVDTGLKHALALHYKSVELNKDLRAAELALGEDLSEENLERLRDIQNQITSVDGTEALIEGFGFLSGRAARSY